MLAEIRATGCYELGIHPFAGHGSTQGASLPAIVESLQGLCPGATGNRFHRLEFSYRDLHVLAARGLRYDASTLRVNCPYLLPAWHDDLSMTLLTYMWEDGIAEQGRQPMQCPAIDLASPGMKILTFHPLNVYLNSAAGEHRQTFLKDHPDLRNCFEADAQPYRRCGRGAQQVLMDVLEHIRCRRVNTCCLGEVADAFGRAAMEAKSC